VTAVIANTVKVDMASLSASQQEHVRDVAGTDPVAQRRVIDSMKARGMLTPAPTTTVVPVGATTGPSASPAQAPAANPDADKLATYTRLTEAGAHIYANVFLSENREAINRARAASKN
jgi:hypothetical protein